MTRLERTTETSVDALFAALVRGECTIVDRFESDGSSYLVARENPPAVAAALALTARERQVLRGAADGTPVKRVAIDLGITASAAAAYLAKARRKTGLASRTEIVRWFSAASRTGGAL